tara:strand:+ start:2082 stop:2264 length:183 start_codon:yes stop_codon:yes gene_type:complete
MTISQHKLKILQEAVQIMIRNHNISQARFNRYMQKQKTTNQTFKTLVKIIKHPEYFWKQI